MSDDLEPLQADEVRVAIRDEKACAIVHLPTRTEVNIFTDSYDKRNPWQVRALLGDIPEKSVLHSALALGFQLRSHEHEIRFGQDRGKRVTTYELYRNCLGDTAAAINAISLIRLLPGVGKEDWVWVTALQYDDRDDPPPNPPENWPPYRNSVT